MLKDLPEPTYQRLPQAPVELVIWQLQFAESTDVSSPAVGARFVERLSNDIGAFQLQRLAAPFVPIVVQGPIASGGQFEPPPGWIVRRGPVAVTVSPQALSVETNAYETYKEFRVLIEQAVGALADSVLLPGEQRLGLRYVDRVAPAGVRRPTGWKSLLADWLLGPLKHPQLGEAVGAYAQQIDFEPDLQNIRATVRQRMFRDADQRGRQTVILDYDVFRDGYRLIEPAEIMAATDLMNETSHRLFEASVTSSLLSVFSSLGDPV
jgi:uncharacterized protein (TIGR04255 family)